jgi:hypothetical protein
MSGTHSEGVVSHPSSGMQDDDDDRDDEHAGETTSALSADARCTESTHRDTEPRSANTANEAAVREVNDQTEAPWEFEVDDEG